MKIALRLTGLLLTLLFCGKTLGYQPSTPQIHIEKDGHNIHIAISNVRPEQIEDLYWNGDSVLSELSALISSEQVRLSRTEDSLFLTIDTTGYEWPLETPSFGVKLKGHGLISSDVLTTPPQSASTGEVHAVWQLLPQVPQGIRAAIALSKTGRSATVALISGAKNTIRTITVLPKIANFLKKFEFEGVSIPNTKNQDAFTVQYTASGGRKSAESRFYDLVGSSKVTEANGILRANLNGMEVVMYKSTGGTSAWTITFTISKVTFKVRF